MDVLGFHLPNTSPEAVLALVAILYFAGAIVPGWQARRWMRQAERSADQVDQLIESLAPMIAFFKKARERMEREEAEQRVKDEAAEKRRRARNGGAT